MSRVGDTADLAAEDLQSIGMKPLEIKRFIRKRAESEAMGQVTSL